jgi:hypothetical protein
MKTRPVPVALLAVAADASCSTCLTDGGYGFHLDELATLEHEGFAGNRSK